MIPVCKLDADFQHKEFKLIAESINSEEGGEVIAAILDGNRVNEKIHRSIASLVCEIFWVLFVVRLLSTTE